MDEPRCDSCRKPFAPDQLVTISGRTVCAACKADVVMNLKSGVATGDRISPERAEEIRRRISRLNIVSFVLAIPGIALQFGIPALAATHVSGTIGLVTVVRLVSLPLIIAGLAFYARMKGRSWAWGLFGVLSCFGLLILAFLPKKCHNCRTSTSYRGKECTACGAPLIP